MKQLTIRGFDLELERQIRSVAKREGISMNKAALRLLRRGAGLEEADREERRIGTRLDRYAGTMTDEEATGILAAIESCERIDTEAWQ